MRRTLTLLAAFLAGCGSGEAPDDDRWDPSKPQDWRALRQQLIELVEVAGTKDAGATLKRFESMLCGRPEVEAVFGAEVGARVWKGWEETLLPDVRKEAGEILVTQVGAGWNQIAIDRIGPASPWNTTPGDQAMLEAMSPKRVTYTVRLHPAGNSKGLRLNGWVFVNERWCGLLKSYSFLAEATTE